MLTPSKAAPLPFKGGILSVPRQQKTTRCGALAAQHSLPLGTWCNFPLDGEALARLETQVGAYWSLGNMEAETLAQSLLAHLL